MSRFSAKEMSEWIDKISKVPHTIKELTEEEQRDNSELCTLAVLKNPYMIEHIAEPSTEMKMIAVNSWGYALSVIKEQTPEICLIAVKQEGAAIEYVKEQTQEICDAAVESGWRNIEYVEKQFQTPELCKNALIMNHRAVSLISNESSKAEAIEMYVNDKDLMRRLFSGREAFEFAKHVNEVSTDDNNLWETFWNNIPDEAETLARELWEQYEAKEQGIEEDYSDLNLVYDDR